MYNPVSTIRIQFHKGFTFTDFHKLIPFFSSLGVGTIYASPIFKAVAGSNHGYDVVDPHVINPEIGTWEQLNLIIQELRKHDIGWLQDIVPNHMAFHPSNKMLMDVLEKGPGSQYAGFFDTAFASDFFQSPLMLPVLDEPIETAVSENKIKITEDGKLQLEYGGNRYPINEQSKELIINKKETNTDRELLLAVAGMQYYRLCDWRETNSIINYRRFFTVNGLICLSMHSEKVFEDYHSLIRTLLYKKMIDGLRVDHIDGLLDPQQYLYRLRDLAGPETYIVIEKILEPGEKLQVEWPVEGTTGYDFLATLNNLFTWTHAERQFNNFYNKIITNVKSFDDRLREKKSLVLFQNMAGELDNLTKYFVQLNLGPDDVLLKNTIASFLIHCPLYRYYGNEFPLQKSEQQMILDVLEDVRRDEKLQTKYLLLLDPLVVKPDEENNEFNDRVTAFYKRLMQFTGPLMAKGIEDTLMYTFNRFIGHNEVGDSAEAFGVPVHSFHSIMAERQKNWPLALNATSTHDTKRGEDLRMRLNVLTDMADEWITLAKRWLALDVCDSQDDVDESEKYFILQTLVGCFPMNGDTTGLIPRLEDYFIKAFREAKRHTNWNDVNQNFETSQQLYVRALIQNQQFLADFLPFAKRVSDFGILNSLSQVVLKMTCPGVPDVYQASITWDLNLVDPDNRRPVDYESLQHAMDASAGLSPLWKTRKDGHVKVFFTKLFLQLRKRHRDLFETGNYVSLEVTGKHKGNILAFAREHQDIRIVVILPLHMARLIPSTDHIDGIDWSGTFICLPERFTPEWADELTGSKGSHDGKLCLGSIFETLPIAVLRFERRHTTRKAGILLPVSSLPSSMPIGDLGPAARAFADFMFRSGQKVWQMLPLNATDETVGFSPYSSYSSIAGSSLLISMDDLVEERLLAASEVPHVVKRAASAVIFSTAQEIKDGLLTKAWQRFKDSCPLKLTNEFDQFILDEGFWLNDFALFEWIFRKHRKPWFEWPVALRDREQQAMEEIRREHHDELRKIKWIQFIFFRQAKRLREYCNKRGVSLMGDLPFYVSYNSADVWQNRHLFEIDVDGAIAGIAGVPPDYFSSTGQLWGMPVYRWDRMKDEGYRWWTSRIKKNMEIYDSLRLDHFRAFVKFWRVPKGETTAVNGTWVNGPGAELFAAIKTDVGEVPFVAEDLGDVDDEVYGLRDHLSLPGMKVLQFAFGNDYPQSTHLPHYYSNNFVVYTGTHDNNTSRGWYEKEISNKQRINLASYTASRSTKRISWLLVRMAYASVADTAIIPMQDILDLPASARINTPSSVEEKNWKWRLRSLPGKETEDIITKLKKDYHR
ncbi:MAG: malto-oligosyltrehalose synthase [Bacteroidota bacterium]